jgi:hypothetical protein
MIKHLAVIRRGHNGRVIPVDGRGVRRVWAEEASKRIQNDRRVLR